MGFYQEGTVARPISGIALASAIPSAKRPSFQYLDTASPSFARYLAIKKNRDDDFYRVAAGGVDLCNVPVPVRPTPGK
jgi:peptidylprolyl isomerase